MKILITSGGTDVPIDDVRKISNMSSGKYGAEIANECLKIPGALVHYLYSYNGKTPRDAGIYNNRKDGLGGTYVSDIFKDYDSYLRQTTALAATSPDIIISAAAVSDYILDKTEGKISSDNDELVIRLKKAPKVLPLLRQYAPESFLVGFKLLVSPTYAEVHKAVKKVFTSGADMVVYNDLTEIRKGNPTRLVFNPDMSFQEAEDAQQLVEIIIQKQYEHRNPKDSYGL